MNTFRSRLCIVVITLCNAHIALAASSDNETLMKFMRANQNKFASEIVTNELLQRDLVLSVTYDDVNITGTYSDAKQELSLRRLESTLGSARIQKERCVPTGSYIGVNAFGVRRSVKRETCTFYTASNNTATRFLRDMPDVTLPMTPNQYRTALEKGIGLRVVFRMKPTESGKVATYDESVTGPTLDTPVERLVRSYTVYGEYQSIGWILPGQTEPTVVYPQ